jgi:excisionase family DNA binding protein
MAKPTARSKPHTAVTCIIKSDINSTSNQVASQPLDIMSVLRARQTAWTAPELTTLLSLGRRTIYDAVQDGQLCALKLGTAIRLSPSDVVVWAEARTTGILRQAA